MMHDRNLGSTRLSCSCLITVAAIAGVGYWTIRAPANPSPARTVVQEFGLIEICHCPPGNPDNCHTINVRPAALPAHLGHGDTLGPCEGFSDEIQGILNALGDKGVELGLDLDLDQALVLAWQAATVVVAPTSTLADTPPLEILSGEFLGMSFMDIPGADFPPGFYRCRVFLEDPKLGAHPVDFELVDEDGEVAAVLQGLALVGSLDLPPEPRIATVVGSVAPEVFFTVDPDDFQGAIPPLCDCDIPNIPCRITAWVLCDNGVWISCTRLVQCGGCPC